MARSLKKGPFADESLLKKVDAMNAAGTNRLSKPGPAVPLFPADGWTYNRSSRRQKTCARYVTEDMVGHKLGEFVATRTYRGHGKDEKKSGVRK